MSLAMLRINSAFLPPHNDEYDLCDDAVAQIVDGNLWLHRIGEDPLSDDGVELVILGSEDIEQLVTYFLTNGEDPENFLEFLKATVDAYG